MKKIIELYRKYGISQETLRKLAARMESTGRSRKGVEMGKNIWYMAENVVTEYLAGEHRVPEGVRAESQNAPEEFAPATEDREYPDAGESIADESLKDRLAQLQAENERLKNRLEKARCWSSAWKKATRELRIARSHSVRLPAVPARQHRYLTANGIRIHCVSEGQGRLLLLLHSFPEFWYSWRHQIPVLSRHFQTVAPDLRGYNDSDKPKGVHSYSLGVIAQDIFELILALGHKRAIVVGHGWGGAVALQFAVHYPSAAERLVILNCPHPAIFLRKLKSSFSQMLRARHFLWFQLPWLPELLISRNPAAFVRRALFHAALCKDAFTGEDLRCFESALSKPHVIHSAVQYYRAAFLDYHRLTRAPRPVTCPTMFLWGEDDPIFGKDLICGMGPYFSDRLDIRYIPHCSHTVHEQHPHLVNRHILEFLADLL